MSTNLVQVTLIIVEHKHVKGTKCAFEAHTTVESFTIRGIFVDATRCVFLVLGPFFYRKTSMYTVEGGARVVSTVCNNRSYISYCDITRIIESHAYLRAKTSSTVSGTRH